MRLFHFLNTSFALKDIRERPLKISRIDELNDPFEFLGVETSNREYRAALNRTKSAISEKKEFFAFPKTGAILSCGVIMQTNIAEFAWDSIYQIIYPGKLAMSIPDLIGLMKLTKAS